MNQFLLVPEMLDLMRISRSTLYAEIARGNIPRPIKLSKGKAAWHRDDIQELIAQRRVAAKGQ